jgi:transposase
MPFGMARYKPVERDALLLPVMLAEQLQPGTFEFALDHLVDRELDLSALDARFRNDETGASAYDPRVMLKIVLLAYSRGLNTSRKIEAACRQNVLFMAISGDSQPSYTHIAKFVRELGEQIQPLFTQVLLVCDRQGLIGRQMFAFDGVKLPSNASKERSGTHAELRHRAERLDKAAGKMIELHRSRDAAGEPQEGEAGGRRQSRIEALQREAQAMREFLARERPRRNAKGQELKSNVTDNDSAKMATSKGVIQGYAAQAAVDAQHQVIVAADVIGSGSEQAMLLPMIGQAQAMADEHTVMTADAGFHSHENMRALQEAGIPALVADGQMRKRDERFAGQQRHRDRPDPLHDKTKVQQKTVRLFRPADFIVDAQNNCCICPAGQRLYSSGSGCRINGRMAHKYKGTHGGCGACTMRTQCLRNPDGTPVRQVAMFASGPGSGHAATELMKRAIDSPRGRTIYSQRIATVEPVFANIRHTKRLDRFTLRGKEKVGTQWRLYCLVHNIEKLARSKSVQNRR